MLGLALQVRVEDLDALGGQRRLVELAATAGLPLGLGRGLGVVWLGGLVVPLGIESLAKVLDLLEQCVEGQLFFGDGRALCLGEEKSSS
jgi:hypothetical protein